MGNSSSSALVEFDQQQETQKITFTLEMMKCTCRACVCAELSTFENMNMQLFIFRWKTNTILGSRSQKKAQGLVDLSKNTFPFVLEVNFLCPTTLFFLIFFPFLVRHNYNSKKQKTKQTKAKQNKEIS